MTRPARYSALLAILASTFMNAAKTPSMRNMIKGSVVYRPDPLTNLSVKPVPNAIVRAYQLSGGEVIASKPTGPDGGFTMVVPRTYKQFKIEVHQEDSQFWDYKPDEEILNQSHPHDLGPIMLKTTDRLTKAEIKTQVEAAMFLQAVGDGSAPSLLDKTTQAFLNGYQDPSIGSCPDAPVPQSIAVSYRGGVEDTGRNSDLPNTLTQKIINLRTTVASMKKLNSIEQRFFSEHRYYAGNSELDRDKLTSLRSYEPPGYCIVLLNGEKAGKNFKYRPFEDGKANYYLLFAAPLYWGRTGEVYLYSDPSNTIRFTYTKGGLKSLDAGEKASDLFPLDLPLFKDKERP